MYFYQRLWFKTNLKLCKIWFDMREYGRMNKVPSVVNFHNFSLWNVLFFLFSMVNKLTFCSHKNIDIEGASQIMSKR